jgi:putative ABC transport system permease protein
VRPSGVFHLYRVRLRARLVQELLAVAGIAVGVALVFVALVANTSLTGSIRELDRGLVGDARLQVVARSPDGLDEHLVRAVRRTDGVEAALATLLSQVNLIGPAGQRSVVLVGGDPRVSRPAGPLIQRFVATTRAAAATHIHAIALPAPLAASLGVAVGGSVRIQAGTHDVSAPVGTLLLRSDYGDLVDNPIAIAPMAFAQTVSDMRGRATRIFVEPLPGRDREVAAALRRVVADRANVVGAGQDVAAFERAASPVTRSTAVFCVFAALIGFLFAFSAVLLTVPQRRRFLADLRLAGHEPWVAIELLLFDAFALGAAGSLLGLLAGDQASRRMLGVVPGFLTYAFVIGEQRIVSWQSVALACAAGLAAACVAVLLPLRDVLSRRGHVDAGARDGYGPGGWAVATALGMLALATTLAVLVPAAGVAALAALTAALMLLLPTMLRGSAAAFEALTRTLRTPVPTLAALELRSHATRMRAVALASTGAVAVFATVALSGSHADLQRGLDAAATAFDRNGDVWATFPGATNAFATTPFRVPASAVAAVRTLPGVARVAVYRGSFLDIGDHRTWVQAPPRTAPVPIAAEQIRQGDVLAATARLREGGWTVLSTAIAERLGVGVGDRVTLPTPVPTQMRVAAVSTNLGWPPGAVVLNADDYARAWGSSAPSALQIDVAAHVSSARVAAAARRTLARALPVRVETLSARIARHYAASREGLHRLTEVSVLVLIAAMLAMASAMGGMIWQRRPAIAALKVHGYPEGELWRALLLESTLLLGTGCLFGAAFGLYGQVVMTRTLESTTDFPVFYSTAGLVAVGILVLVTLVAVAMIAVPGWLAVRVRPTPGGAA